jgi:hypothetical protein
MRSVKTRGNDQFEGMRRRLESEGASTGATASGLQQQQQVGAEASRRRTMGQQLLDEVRGAF